MQLIVLVVFLVGGHLILSDLYPQASYRARKAVRSYSAPPKATLKSISLPLALRLERYMPIGKYRRIKLANTLQAAHFDVSPELYLSQALCAALFFAVITAPMGALLSPLLSLVFIALAAAVFVGETGKAAKAAKAKREAIESELPHFASTIAEELKSSRDIIALLSSYSKIAGAAFCRELDITLADMRTGSRTEAVMRLSNRVGSLGLSKICRGLVSSMEGYDQTVYFEIVAHDLENEQDQKTERLIQSLYNKIKPYTFLLLGCMVLLLLTAIGIYMFKTLSI